MMAQRSIALLAIALVAQGPGAGALVDRPSATVTRTREQRPPGRSIAAARANIVVAQNGSGDFRTIQAALDAVPRDNDATKIILVKAGTYVEKVYVNAPHVALVGEDRDRTRIVYAELRRNWRVNHDSDWGAAVVNIGDEVTDLVIANLTVRNNYGELHADHDHQFAIRSGGKATRIVLLHATVSADGGDTLSLWNTDSGMYYHADCSFEGWVDYVCPRGWCYITDSRFFGHNTASASIWHDGSRDKDQKLVIRHSRFDGAAGFPLGRNHRDGQFYLLDCEFSANMADRPIYQASPAASYQWGERYYYDNCHRDGGDIAWFADNLAKADGAPCASEMTAAWTFRGRWDPEASMPAVLPFAAVPRPRVAARDVSIRGTTLQWAVGRDARSHRVHLDTANPPAFRAERAVASYDTGTLRPGTIYYWRVDEVTGSAVVTGPVWQFTTARSP
jgi:pectinesterase